jgi:hypothetical protein
MEEKNQNRIGMASHDCLKKITKGSENIIVVDPKDELQKSLNSYSLQKDNATKKENQK